MIRVGFVSYSELPDEKQLIARLGKPAVARLSEGRRGKSRIEALLGGCLLAAMFPEADLSRLERTETGRPFLRDCPDVDFNLSHTNGMVVCALETGKNLRVGVDVERMRGRTIAEMTRIAERWFTEAESARFSDDPTERTFLEIWTAKEAAAKWDGGGLRVLRGIDTAALPLTLRTYFVDDAVITLACARGKERCATIEPVPCKFL